MSEHDETDATGGDGPASRVGADATEPPAPDGLEALVERFVDLAVYAPVGVAVTLRDELPRHVKQGRQALENRIQLARFIGQLAVQTGQRELQKRIEQQRAAREQQAADTSTGDGPDTAVPDVADVADVAALTETPADPAPAAREHVVEPAVSATDEAPPASALPISDYESLPAINVVDRLRSMTPDEIELVRRFEQAHRARRTILAKIDQLQERHAAE